MDFGFTKEESEFREELHNFLLKEVTEEVANECRQWRGPAAPAGPHTHELLLKLGAKGWLAPSWPKEYGGSGLPETYRFIVQEEMAYFGMRSPHAVNLAGPVILHHGSEEMKKKILPQCARGEIRFGLGYTEPQAGSDLAALEMRAAKDGDNYIINGQKTFNSHVHFADYHWLLVLTNPEAKPKHRGMSLFVVDLNSPGISINPIWTMGGERANEVFYDNVVVPAENLVGEENRGFYYIMEDLEYERTFPSSDVQYYLEEVIKCAKTVVRDGKPLISDPAVQQGIAELTTEIEVGRLLFYRLACMHRDKTPILFEGTISKVFVSELIQRIAMFGSDILGLYGQLQEGSKWAPLDGEIEHINRYSIIESIWGGTNEICRTVIATRALKMPVA